MQLDGAAAAQTTKKLIKKKGAKAKPAKELTAEEKRALEKQKRADEAKAKAEEKKKLAERAKADAAKKLAEKKKALEAEKLAKAKALQEKKAAAAKALELKKIAKAKAEQERQAAKAKAQEERLAAKAKAEEARKLAAKQKEEAREQARLAKLKAIEDAKQAKIQAAEAARQAEIARLTAMEVAKTGNNGELRSEQQVSEQKSTGFLGLFGAKPQKASMLAETRALDAVLEQKEARKKFRVKPEFEPQTVDYPGYQPGTIVIDTSARRLYLIQSSQTARRYAIAVGRDGLQFHGKVAVGDKQEWPRWIPTLDMQKREPKHYGQYKDGMPGGPDNPLGARAIYLYDGKKDTHLRIHGTNQPQSIGTSASNGCFRMINEHVQDLYSRVKIGTQVIVL
ncbi:MAG: L,D-transpeptidase family protein [Rhizobiales bacterium]|nr:L,D-transpeptidase family protein [Hyphomicrobiales bacterium]